MRNSLIYLLKKGRNLINRYLYNLERDPLKEAQQDRVVPWFKDNGDKTHRLNYDLLPTSIVFDLGGYEGQWSSDIFAMYQCKIEIFEPVSSYAENISKRFKHNSNITAYPFGLSSNTKQLDISIDDNASSTFKESDNTIKIDLVKIDDFLNSHSISHVDLIKINIEGGEYDLLQHMIDNNLVRLFENIQVQFHDFVPEASEKMKKIQDGLSKTHSLSYQYEFVWENWVLKN